MTSERATAYGRVVATLDELAATKLQPSEVEQLRAAADTLLFSESLDAPGAREALDGVEQLTTHLAEVASRWGIEPARDLVRA